MKKTYSIKKLGWTEEEWGMMALAGDCLFRIREDDGGFISSCQKNLGAGMIISATGQTVEEAQAECQEYLEGEVLAYLDEHDGKIKIEDLKLGRNEVNGWIILKDYKGSNEIQYFVKMNHENVPVSKPVIIGLLEDIQYWEGS